MFSLQATIIVLFQHTAARRRLAGAVDVITALSGVSTHSRPKAAGYRQFAIAAKNGSFNTQPPEGGWFYNG